VYINSHCEYHQIHSVYTLHTMLSILFNITELSFVMYTDQAGNQENQKITGESEIVLI